MRLSFNVNAAPGCFTANAQENTNGGCCGERYGDFFCAAHVGTVYGSNFFTAGMK